METVARIESRTVSVEIRDNNDLPTFIGTIQGQPHAIEKIGNNTRIVIHNDGKPVAGLWVDRIIKGGAFGEALPTDRGRV